MSSHSSNHHDEVVVRGDKNSPSRQVERPAERAKVHPGTHGYPESGFNPPPAVRPGENSEIPFRFYGFPIPSRIALSGSWTFFLRPDTVQTSETPGPWNSQA